MPRRREALQHGRISLFTVVEGGNFVPLQQRSSRHLVSESQLGAEIFEAKGLVHALIKGPGAQFAFVPEHPLTP